ncbi:MAG: helix-turn-helix domain-containing protein [Granulosicoccus sp.]
MQYYSQFTIKQRYQIYALFKKNHLQAEIAEIVGVHKSTISRGIRRNSSRCSYRPKQAPAKALRRREEMVRYGILESAWSCVEQLLNLDWSPEQICL